MQPSLKRRQIPKSGPRWPAANAGGLQHATMSLDGAVIPAGEIGRACVAGIDRLSDRSNKGTCRASSGTAQSSFIKTVG